VSLQVERVGAEAAQAVHAVVHAAFEARPVLDPPAAALSETSAELEERLRGHGGLLARVDGTPAGALVLDPAGTTMYLRRFGVVPALQGHGVAAALVEAATEVAEGYDDLTVVAREELPGTIAFWERQGFREVRREPPSVELRRPVRTVVRQAPDAEAMRALGRAVADRLAPGDLIVLTGALGAGKTTFTQGLGAGLGVRGAVTSPTFVIARVHPSEVGGPALVHVDAYRIGGIEELDDLDLDTDLDRAVTVVEWGEGLAEGLSDSRLGIHLVRGDDDEQRRVEITAVGPRWQGVSFRDLP